MAGEDICVLVPIAYVVAPDLTFACVVSLWIVSVVIKQSCSTGFHTTCGALPQQLFGILL